MLRVSNLSVSIGAVLIVRDACIEVREGEMCALIGRNGAGKTTLMRGLMGALPATGRAELKHIDVLGLPAHHRAAHGIGYMPEERRLVPAFTVEENIRVPSWSTRLDGSETRLKWIFSMMPEIEQLRNRRALELSGGQQKMVALARSLMAGRRLLLLDEPLEGVAPAMARRLAEVLANLRREGVSALVAESSGSNFAGMLTNAYRIERGMVERLCDGDMARSLKATA